MNELVILSGSYKEEGGIPLDRMLVEEITQHLRLIFM